MFYQKKVRDYLMIYQLKNDGILILAIFDTRQDPSVLNKLLP
jgi:hypothetical protein